MQCRGAIVPGPGGGSGGGKVSDNDTTAGTLSEKIVGAGSVTVTILNPGGNEQLEIEVDLTTIEGFIDNLEAAVTALDGRLDTAESDISTLQDDVSNLTADFTTIETTLYRAAWWATRPARFGASSDIDDEFDSDTSANYTLIGASFSGTITQDAFVTASPRVGWAGTANEIRPSHVSIQAADVVDTFLSRSKTLDTNCWIWARAVITSRIVSAPTGGSNEQFVGLYLNDNFATFANTFNVATGAPVTAGPITHRALCQYRESAGTFAVAGSIGFSSFQTSSLGTQFFIKKVGSVLKGYISDDQLSWVKLGQRSFAGTMPNKVGLRVYEDGANTDGSMIVHWDFLRYGTGDVVLP
jgi:hypothetical protein